MIWPWLLLLFMTVHDLTVVFSPGQSAGTMVFLWKRSLSSFPLILFLTPPLCMFPCINQTAFVLWLDLLPCFQQLESAHFLVSCGSPCAYVPYLRSWRSEKASEFTPAQPGQFASVSKSGGQCLKPELRAISLLSTPAVRALLA